MTHIRARRLRSAPRRSGLCDVTEWFIFFAPSFPLLVAMVLGLGLSSHSCTRVSGDVPNITQPRICGNITFFDPESSYKTSESMFSIDISHPVLPVKDGFVPGAAYTIAIKEYTEEMVRELSIAIIQTERLKSSSSHLKSRTTLVKSSTMRVLHDCGFDAATSNHYNHAQRIAQNVSLVWETTTITTGCFHIFLTIRLNTTEKYVRLQRHFCQWSDCVRYLTSAFGAISSPRFPLPYPDNQICTTYIHTIKQNHRVYLQFQYFDLEKAYESACVDYVSVKTDPRENVSRKLCGVYDERDLTQLSFISDGNLMIVKFVSDVKTGSSGFKATYYIQPETGLDCNNTFNDTQGRITSVNYPSPYFPNLHCFITISVPSEYRIALFVDYLDLMTSQSDECADYLEIYADPNDFTSGRKGQKLCGYLQSPNTNSTTLTTAASSENRMTLLFHTDHVNEGRGFYVNYKSIKSCMNETYHEENGTLTSVNYPDHYPNSQECYAFINISHPWYVIEVQFQRLHTENVRGDHFAMDADCRLDYVEIHDGASVQRLCGDWSGRETQLRFRSVGSSIVIRFVTNSHVTAPGYVATWRAVVNDTSKLPCPSAWLSYKEFCYEIVEAEMTWTQAEADCQLRGGHLVQIDAPDVDQFLDHQIKHWINHTPSNAYWTGGNDREYESDFFWSDGEPFTNYTNWFGGWQRYQGYNRQPNDDSWGAQDCVEMRQTFGYPSKGVGVTTRLFWNDRNCDVTNRFICQKAKHSGSVEQAPPGCSSSVTLTDQSANGTFSSPNFPGLYPNFVRCNLSVTAPPGRQVQIRFPVFHIEGPQESNNKCDYDFVLLASVGENGSIQATKRLCGNQSDSDKLLYYVTIGRKLVMQFVSDHSRVFNGFLAVYHIFPGVKRKIQTFLDSLNGTLQSDGYPANNYSVNTLYTWEIHAPLGHRIAARIHVADIEYDVTCAYDALSLKSSNDSKPKDKVICGKDMSNITFLSVKRSMYVRFKSDFSMNGRGFTLTWQAYPVDPCTIRNITVGTDSFGYVNSYNFPYRYFNNLACTYEIATTPNESIWLEFMNFSLSNRDRDCRDHVTVISTYSQSEESITLCGHITGQLPMFLSDSNKIVLKFNTDNLDNGIGFLAFYQSVVETPFRHVSYIHVHANTSGNVTSVGYPFTYPAGLDHQLVVVAPLGYHIHLNFLYVDIESGGHNCSHDYVQVLDHHSPRNTSATWRTHKLCNRNQTEFNSSYVSYLNKLWIRLETDSDRMTTYGGFLAQYEVVLDHLFMNKTRLMSNLTHCSEDTCQNGGQCLRTSDDVRCKCPANYTGVLCHLSQCDQRPCGDHGDCHLAASGYTCRCHTGYLGNHCSVLFRECARVFCSSHGFCNRDNNAFRSCTCNNGWSGSDCSVRDAMSPQPKTLGERLLEEPFWIGIIVVLSVLVIAGLVFVLKKKCAKYFSCACVRFFKKDGVKDDKLGRKSSTATDTYSNPSFTRDPSPLSFGRANGRHFVKPTIMIDSESVTQSPMSDHRSMDSIDHGYTLQNGDAFRANSPTPSNSSLHTIEEEKHESPTSNGSPNIDMRLALSRGTALAGKIANEENKDCGQLGAANSAIPSKIMSNLRDKKAASSATLHNSESEENVDDILLTFKSGSLDSAPTTRPESNLVVVDMHPPPKGQDSLSIPRDAAAVGGLSQTDDPDRRDAAAIDGFRHRRVNSAQRRKEFADSVRRSRNMISHGGVDSNPNSIKQIGSVSLDRTESVDSAHSCPPRIQPKPRYALRYQARSLDLLDSEIASICQQRESIRNKNRHDPDKIEGSSVSHKDKHSHKSKSTRKSSDEGRSSHHHRHHSGSSGSRRRRKSRSHDEISDAPEMCSSCYYSCSQSCRCSDSDEGNANDTCSIRSCRSESCVNRSDSKSSSSSCNSRSHHCYRHHHNHHHHHHCNHHRSEQHHCNNHSQHSHHRHHSRHQHHGSYKYSQRLRRKLRDEHRAHSIDLPTSTAHAAETLTPLHRNHTEPRHKSSKVHVQRHAHSTSDLALKDTSKHRRADPGKPPQSRTSRVASQDSVRSSSATRRSSSDGRWSSVEVDSISHNKSDKQTLLTVPSFDTVFVSDNDSNCGSSEQSSVRVENETLSSSGISADIKKSSTCTNVITDNTDETMFLDKTRLSEEYLSSEERAIVCHFDEDKTRDRQQVFMYDNNTTDAQRNVTNDDLKSSPDFQASIVQNVLAYINKLPLKHPLHDSAYQSKEQSTDKSNSKPNSNVVSPTSSVSGLYRRTQNPKFPLKNKGTLNDYRSEDQSIRSQLQMTAQKLAALKGALSDTSDSNMSSEETAPPNGENTFNRARWSSGDVQHKLKRSKVAPMRILSMIADEEMEHACADENQSHPLHDLNAPGFLSLNRTAVGISADACCSDDSLSENVTEL